MEKHDAAENSENSENSYATGYAACAAYMQLLIHKLWRRVWEGKDEQPLRLEGEGGAPGILQKWHDFWNAGPSKIAEGLFVGSAADAACAPNLNRDGIALVVNVTEDLPNFFEGIGYGSPEYVRVPLLDTPDASFQPHAEAVKSALQKIKEVREDGGNVLVHCLMGASRSVSIACLVLMGDSADCTAEDAYAVVKAKRSPARINVSFMQDLKDRDQWL